jgi:hypothetical protein
MPSLCVVPYRLGDPRVVPCFRWLFLVGMSPSETPGSRSAATTQFFTDRAGLRPSRKVSALPSPSTLRFSWRSPFQGLTTVRLRYNLPTCLPPCRSRPSFRPAYGDFYIRAFGGLVARTAAGYHYSGNWASSTGGTYRSTPARTPTSIAATSNGASGHSP